MKPAVLPVVAGVELATAIAPLPLPPPIATLASCPPSSSVALEQIGGQVGIALPSGVRLTVVTTVAEDLCCAGNGAPRPGSWQQRPPQSGCTLPALPTRARPSGASPPALDHPLLPPRTRRPVQRCLSRSALTQWITMVVDSCQIFPKAPSSSHDHDECLSSGDHETLHRRAG